MRTYLTEFYIKVYYKVKLNNVSYLHVLTSQVSDHFHYLIYSIGCDQAILV